MTMSSSSGFKPARFVWIQRWRGFLSSAADDRSGIAVVEFALLLPVMITICLAGAELANAIENQRKVMLYTRVVADLSGRTSVDSIDKIFNAASIVLLPYDPSAITVRVSAIGVQKSGKKFVGRVCSSIANGNTTARPVRQKAGTNDIPDVPEGFLYDEAHYMLAEVSMPYRPILGSTLFTSIFGPNGLVFSKQMPWADRTDTEIILPGGSKCP